MTHINTSIQSAVGPWIPLTLETTKCEAGSAVPEFRLEGDNKVRLRGAIKVKAGQEVIPAFSAPTIASFPGTVTVGNHSVYSPAVHFVKATPTHTASTVLEFFEKNIDLAGGETAKSEDQIDLDGIVILQV